MLLTVQNNLSITGNWKGVHKTQPYSQRSSDPMLSSVLWTLPSYFNCNTRYIRHLWNGNFQSISYSKGNILPLLLPLQIYRSICLLDTLSKCYANFLLKSAGVLKNWISSMNNKQVFGTILLVSHLCHIFLLLKKEQRSKRKLTDFKTVFDPTDRHYHWLTCKHFCPYFIIITSSKPASHH